MKKSFAGVAYKIKLHMFAGCLTRFRNGFGRALLSNPETRNRKLVLSMRPFRYFEKMLFCGHQQREMERCSASSSLFQPLSSFSANWKLRSGGPQTTNGECGGSEGIGDFEVWSLKPAV